MRVAGKPLAQLLQHHEKTDFQGTNLVGTALQQWSAPIGGTEKGVALFYFISV